LQGRNSIPKACPLCRHSPLEPDDCNPNKSLKLTVRAFLKGQEKKRAEKERASSAVQTPKEVDSPAPPASAQSPASENHVNGAPEQPVADQPAVGDGGEDGAETAANADAPEVGSSRVMTKVKTKNQADIKNDQEATVDDSVPATENAAEDKEIDSEGDGKQDQKEVGPANANNAAGWGMNGQMFPYGYGANQNGFAMGWSQPGVFNPMMQMQMQNNMGGNWGYQNMMGSFPTS
jgi:hypothetical protein